MSGRLPPAQSAESGICDVGSPVWYGSSSARSVVTSRAIVPTGDQQKASLPNVTYASSESPGGTFRHQFTVNGELRAPMRFVGPNGAQFVVEPNYSASGSTSNQPRKTV